MLLFNRQLTLHGSERQAMPWVAAVTDHVNKSTGLDVACWAGLFGVPVGTVAWSAVLESQADFMTATAPLAADDTYQALLEQGEPLTREPAVDRLMNIIDGVPTGVPPLGAVARITTAVTNGERFTEAVAWGLDIHHHVQSVAGGSGYFGMELFGAYGTLAWLAVYDDMAACDKARVAMSSDAGFMERLSASGGLFVPASAREVQSIRIL